MICIVILLFLLFAGKETTDHQEIVRHLEKKGLVNVQEPGNLRKRKLLHDLVLDRQSEMAGMTRDEAQPVTMTK